METNEQEYFFWMVVMWDRENRNARTERVEGPRDDRRSAESIVSGS
jgi:hypothetical protein